MRIPKILTCLSEYNMITILLQIFQGQYLKAEEKLLQLIKKLDKDHNDLRLVYGWAIFYISSCI